MRKFPPFAISLTVAFILMLSAAQLNAVDLGLIVTQDVYSDDLFLRDPDSVGYRAVITPWASFMLNNNGEVYLSLGGGPLYESREWKFIVEVMRSEVTLRNGTGFEFEFGRMPYVDPLGLIAVGLFDGFKLSHDIGAGTLSFGGWYTGLLYKKSANITVSPEDYFDYFTNFELTDMNTYFASRRILTALEYENDTLADLMWLKLALMGQFDLNNREDKYHSEYLAGKAIIPFRNTLFLSAGGAVELLQHTPDKDAKIAFLGEAGASWITPSLFNDRLSLTGRFSSGKITNTAMGSFSPLTTEAQGGVLRAMLSDLIVFRLDYLIRLHRTLSMDTTLSYFFKAVSNSTYALGGEAFFTLNWVPTSDIQLRFNGGAFIPGLGDVIPSERPHVLLNLAASLAIY